MNAGLDGLVQWIGSIMCFLSEALFHGILGLRAGDSWVWRFSFHGMIGFSGFSAFRGSWIWFFKVWSFGFS
jgi:hypothetical protein